MDGRSLILIECACKEDVFMELGQRLKEQRNRLHMTQEELAEKCYVSRQTVSSWENDKSYPDIHSLLMLSELFGVSLDVLIKGDIEQMKEKIDQASVEKFKRDSNIFAVLLIAGIATPIPLVKWLGVPGAVLWAILMAGALYFAFRVERTKKAQNMYTYKEIVAFMNGEKLDEIEKAREDGKRHYQQIVFALISAVIGLVAAIVLTVIFRKM